MKIKNMIGDFKGKLTDKTKRFKRQIELKRLEKYANEIDMVLTLYNKKSCDETMMIKGLRRSSGETTVRKTHQEDVEKITKEIAKKLGLNEQIVGIMAKHHDIGHTFLGHSGEWWISNIQEDDGLGMVCHNAVGSRELVFTEHIYDQIIEKIKVHNSEIGLEKLEKIREALWLIMDGINTHNGETPEKEYIPDIRKEEKDFELEMLKCYGIKGYDRTIKPATAEACLMRLADQISYIPLEMVKSKDRLDNFNTDKSKKIIVEDNKNRYEKDNNSKLNNIKHYLEKENTILSRQSEQGGEQKEKDVINKIKKESAKKSSKNVTSENKNIKLGDCKKEKGECEIQEFER